MKIKMKPEFLVHVLPARGDTEVDVITVPMEELSSTSIGHKLDLYVEDKWSIYKIEHSHDRRGSGERLLYVRPCGQIFN